MESQFKTIEDVNSYFLKRDKSVYEVIDDIRNSNNNEYPDRISKPTLGLKHSSDDVIKYAEELKQYEILKKENDKQKEIYNLEQQRLNSLIEEFIKDQSGLNNIPEKYRDKVYNYAYSKSHSNGYYEVYLTLGDLVDIFIG